MNAETLQARREGLLREDEYIRPPVTLARLRASKAKVRRDCECGSRWPPNCQCWSCRNSRFGNLCAKCCPSRGTKSYGYSDGEEEEDFDPDAYGLVDCDIYDAEERDRPARRSSRWYIKC